MTRTDNDPRTTAELVTEMERLFRHNLEFLAMDCGSSSITMTAATESIYGMSGRGNPRAVRIIETLAEYGLVKIDGKKRRRVMVSQNGHRLLAGATLAQLKA